MHPVIIVTPMQSKKHYAWNFLVILCLPFSLPFPENIHSSTENSFSLCSGKVRIKSDDLGLGNLPR